MQNAPEICVAFYKHATPQTWPESCCQSQLQVCYFGGVSTRQPPFDTEKTQILPPTSAFGKAKMIWASKTYGQIVHLGWDDDDYLCTMPDDTVVKVRKAHLHHWIGMNPNGYDVLARQINL